MKTPRTELRRENLTLVVSYCTSQIPSTGLRHPSKVPESDPRSVYTLMGGEHSSFMMLVTSTKTIRLIRGGLMGVGEEGEGGGGIIYLSLRCHHQNDSCILNVSIIVRDKVTTRTVSTDHNF